MKALVTLTFEYEIPDQPSERLRAYGTTVADEALEVDREQFAGDPYSLMHVLDGDDYTVKIEAVQSDKEDRP